MDHRKGFLVSAVVHLTLLTLLVSWVPAPHETPEPEGERPQTSRVFMPPPEVLRQMASAAPAPKPPPPAAVPAPPPAPTPASGKDRISVGAPSNLRQEGPLILRRDDDLTKVAKGRPDAVPTPAATPEPVAEPARQARSAASEEQTGAAGLRLPRDGGPLPGGGEGSRETPGEAGALAAALQQLQQRGPSGDLGLPDGTGRQMGALLFDPRGADFTRWVNHFKNEVYRNWLIPQGALLGFGGEVKIEFTVQRDGSMTDVRMVSSSGTPALDRAARGALLGSLLMPLPEDYAPASVTMLVTFQYARG